MRIQRIFFLIYFLIAIFAIQRANATHIRAGEITCKIISAPARLYEFTLTLYLDKKSSVDQPTALFNFGDGSACQEQPSEPAIEYNNEIRIRAYKVTHAYASNGTFVISFNGENRNANTKNINDGNSVNLSFYVETKIVIDPFLGINNSPILQVPPIDNGAVNQVFIHNPGAIDPDGDSIAYIPVASQSFVGSSNINECPTGFPNPVPRYKYPNDPFFGGSSEAGGPPTYTINPITGQITWDTPAQPGQYNIAFKVEKFRKIGNQYVSMGYVIRDMQILIEDTNNKRPKLTVPSDTCVIAGTKIEKIIKGEDPDGNSLTLISYGDVYTLLNSPAQFVVVPPQPKPTPIQGKFTWETNCQHIREKSYQVTFKVEDNPPGAIPHLVDIKTWQIKVVAPAPQNVIAQPTGVKSIQLTWDPYTCGNAQKLTIWRRSGSYSFPTAPCNTGIPANAGFEKVGEVGIGITSFLDNSKSLKKGIQYCYRIVAEFAPAPETPFAPFVQSLASDEACAQLKLMSPVITNVTIDKTGSTDGEITIRWTRPLELDGIAFPAPYKYELYRGEGLEGNNYTLISTHNNLLDTLFVDKPINTIDQPYHYKVLFYSTNVLVDSSDAASSIFVMYEQPSCPPTLQIDPINCETYIVNTPCDNNSFKNTLTWNTQFDCSSQNPNPTITITWKVNSPWNNERFDIYRQVNGVGAFQLVGTATQNQYVDPITFGNTYCYYVHSKGSYTHPLLKDLVLLNNSQQRCTSQSGGAASYEIYYADRSEDTLSMQLLQSNINANSFVHNNISHYAYCYAIKTVNSQGQRSAFSNVVCNDNCPYYELPNIFTPNDDGANDILVPIHEPNEKCPRFVESVEFQVYNRWGQPVYTAANQETKNNIYINWDGKTNDGKLLATGIYYYLAKVKFIRLHGGEDPVLIKGWIHLLR